MAWTWLMSISKAKAQPASWMGWSKMGFRPHSEWPNSVSVKSPASIHSLTMVETVALFSPVWRQMSARLMG